MAIVQRFFSTTGAGAADGTTWADRAELDPAGAWSTVITGHDFVGSGNSLQCFVGPGTYTFTTALATGLFANPPTVANLLMFCGCDSSGVLLAIPDPDWFSNMAAFDDSTLPVIATTTNIITTSLANCSWFLMRFTASGRNGGVLTGGHFDWCAVADSTNNTAAIGASGVASLTNSVVSMSGAAFDTAVTSVLPVYNVKMLGVTGSSGNRDGFRTSGQTALIVYDRLCASGFGGDGLSSASATAGHTLGFKRCTSVNNGGNGILFPATASQTGVNVVRDCQITGNGAYGLDGQSAANILLSHSRFRDNTSGNINGLLNYPVDVDNYTTDSDDATEYVDAASGDFQIKTTAATYGMGFGVSDQLPSGGSGGGLRLAGRGGLAMGA